MPRPTGKEVIGKYYGAEIWIDWDKLFSKDMSIRATNFSLRKLIIVISLAFIFLTLFIKITNGENIFSNLLNPGLTELLFWLSMMILAVFSTNGFKYKAKHPIHEKTFIEDHIYPEVATLFQKCLDIPAPELINYLLVEFQDNEEIKKIERVNNIDSNKLHSILEEYISNNKTDWIKRILLSSFKVFHQRKTPGIDYKTLFQALVRESFEFSE